MTYKLKLNQVRAVLGMEIKLEAIKLMDGTMLEVEKLEVGFPVFVIAEDGTMTPAPMGEHTLEDGTTIELDNAGIIVEVSAKEDESEDAEEAVEDVIEVSGEEAKIEEKVDVAMEDVAKIVEEKVEEKFKMMFEVIEEVATEVAGIKEEMGAMKTKMEKFSKMPAAGAAPKMTVTSEKLDAFDAKLEFIKSLKK